VADPSTYRPKTGSIPTQPGVYRFRDKDGRVVYVGKAKSLRARLSSYFQDVANLHPRTASMVTTAASVEWTVVGTEVEVRRRLVEQHEAGALGQRHGDPHPLPLPARQLVDRAFGEVEGACRGQGLGDGTFVLARPAAEQPLVRMPAAADQVDDRDAVRRDRLLRKQAEHAGDVAGRA